MTLGELLRGADVLEYHADPDTPVNCPRYDSRQVGPKDVFVAMPGFEQDGRKFIPGAMAAGAAACVAEAAPEQGGVPYVLVASARKALAAMSVNYFGDPAAAMQLVAVTGTNGKTTVTYLMQHVISQVLGAGAGVVGTLGGVAGDVYFPSDRTTPESFELQKMLRGMADAGCGYVAMEASSHALELHRLDGIRFRAGIFTNLTRDHLDFHKTMENYLHAKSLLFGVSELGIINAGDPACGYLTEHASCPVVTYAAEGRGADYRAADIVLASDSVSYTALTPRGEAAVRVGIPGHFTVENSMAVLACCCEMGMDLEKVAAALGTARGVPGRMEVVPGAKDFTVIIDYAHTPDALENVLTAARKTTKGRVCVLFGCGGDRDRTKRPIMGELGVRLADFAYITSDNPRTEVPQAIIDDILAGVPRGTEGKYTVICDRREAIRKAVCGALPGDVLILAGKGHETYQIIGKEKTHLDEREEVAAALMLRYGNGKDTSF